MNVNGNVNNLKQLVALPAMLLILTGLTISESGATDITEGTMIVIPNHASYEYKIGTFTGVSANAPFGSEGSCPISRSVNTEWPANSTIELKKRFKLPVGATNLRVQMSVDNDAEVFINNTSIGSVTHGGCALVDELLLTAPDLALIPGANNIRVVAQDTGGDSFVDLRVLVDVPPQ